MSAISNGPREERKVPNGKRKEVYQNWLAQFFKSDYDQENEVEDVNQRQETSFLAFEECMVANGATWKARYGVELKQLKYKKNN